MKTKKITKQFLEKHNVCQDGLDWVTEQGMIGMETIPFIKKLIETDKLDWANWTITRMINYKQRVQYAVFAAEQVIDIFEKEYLNDDRPRKAIEAAKKCIKNPSKKNKEASAHAAYAAAAAASAAAAYAYAASYVASASYASAYAYAAAYAAYAASASSASATAYAASVAASSASAYAYAANEKKTYINILRYGIGLIEGEV